jgi:hypothetical protein
LTSLDKADFRLIGRSRAVANTSLGQITLDSIKVNVSTSLNGLQGLKGFTTIKSVDVQGGTQNAINLAINGNFHPLQVVPVLATEFISVSIFNPSNLNLATGDLSKSVLRLPHLDI